MRAYDRRLLIIAVALLPWLAEPAGAAAPSKSVKECGEELREQQPALEAAGETPQEFFHACWWHSRPGQPTPIEAPRASWDPRKLDRDRVAAGATPATTAMPRRARVRRLPAVAITKAPVVDQPWRPRRIQAAGWPTRAPAPAAPRFEAAEPPPFASIVARPARGDVVTIGPGPLGSRVCVDLRPVLGGGPGNGACVSLPVNLPVQIP